MSEKPALVVLGGFAGAGKSTLSARLSSEFNFPVFSTDTINDGLRPLLGMSFHDTGKVVHPLLWHLIRAQMKNNMIVILDTNMCQQQSWDNLDKLKKSMPEVVVISLILKCDFKTHQQRIEHRGRTNKDHLNLGGEELGDVMHKYDFIQNLRRPDLRVVNANGSPDHVFEQVTRVLEEELGVELRRRV